ncbi:MAG: hypothetical protein Q8P24_21890 [Desulfobacterales bacterium]|nr:hypothetical protein [Desulfobacterales bacterium]
MKKMEDCSTVSDAVGCIQHVGGRLRVLWQNAKANINTPDQHAAFQKFVLMVLSSEIKELNEIMKELAEKFEGIKYKPLETK